MGIRVAVDVTSAVIQAAGVSRYTRDLLTQLAMLPNAPIMLPHYAAAHVRSPLPLTVPPVRVRRSTRPWYLEIMARHLMQYPASGPWRSADLYHALDVVFPPLDALPVVSTIHDLSFFAYPEHHTRAFGTYMRAVTPMLVRRARLIIADSHSTKRDLMERLKVPDERIRVVHLGVADRFRASPSAEAITAIRRRYKLPHQFILSVGTLEPRKNLRGTLSAYRLLHSRMRDLPPLVLVGGAGWGVDANGLLRPDEMTRILRLGYVPDEDLLGLYSTASAFVYPSFYEGFGLPVLEALASGIPTITSNVSSLPEVAGDAAVLVNPDSPEEIAEALERVLADKDLAARLRVAGISRAAQFTLARFAASTASVYEEAIAA